MKWPWSKPAPEPTAEERFTEMVTCMWEDDHEAWAYMDGRHVDTWQHPSGIRLHKGSYGWWASYPHVTMTREQSKRCSEIGNAKTRAETDEAINAAAKNVIDYMEKQTA